MAADLDARASEVSNVQFEGQDRLDFPSTQDPPKVGADCNGIVHDSEERRIHGEAKDDGDASYVFVDGADDTASDGTLDTDCSVHPSKAPILNEEKTFPETNASSLDEERQVKIEEFRIEEQRGDTESVNDETAVLSSQNNLSSEGLQCQSNGNGVDKSDLVEENIKLVSAAMVEGDQESLTMHNSAHELQLPESAKEEKSEEENEVAPGEKLESDVMVTEAVESMVNHLPNGEAKEEAEDYYHQTDVPNAVESNLRELDNCQEKVEETNNTVLNEEEKVEDMNNVASNEEKVVDEMPNEEGKVEGLNIALSNEEAEKNQFDGEDKKVEEQSNMHSSAHDVGIDQEDSETVILENVETELHQIGSGKEEGEVTAEAPVDKTTKQLAKENELNVDVAAFSVEENHLESEAMDGADRNDIHVGSEAMDGDDGNGINVSACPVEEIVSEIEVTHNSEEVHQDTATSHTSETESEYKLVNESVEDSKNPSHPAGDVKPIIMFGNISAEYGNGLHTPAKFSLLEPVESTSSSSVYCEKPASKLDNGSIEIDRAEPRIPVDDMDSATRTMNGSVESCDNLPSGPVGADDVNEGSPLSQVSASNGENAQESVSSAIDIQDEGDQSVSGHSDGKQILEEIEGVEGVDSNENPPPPPENSTIDLPEQHKVEEEVVNRSFYLIRIPRYLDDKIRNEIDLAQLQVDEKTRSRDAIRSTIQLKRATCNDYHDKFEAAKSEERAARDAYSAKRHEMDSILSVINRMKNATSIDDIDEKIHNMDYRIEHETVPLKEERQLLREIKQLKHDREQLRASLGRQAEIQPTSEQRDRIEERFKLLKQELDSAKNGVLRAEATTREAKKTCSDEYEKLKELQGQFRAADDLRQGAYTHLQNLRKQLYDKKKYFRMYREDLRKAEDYAFRGDRDALQQLCLNQVETFMDLWNKNDEFRNEYVRCNVNSTLRRLKTLDGRRLGPDEEPPVLHTAVQGKVDNAIVVLDKIDSTNPLPLESQVADISSVVNSGHTYPKADIKSVVNLEQRAPTKSKKAMKPIALENTSATVSGREGTDENAELNKRTLEEEELTRKAEELRKEEAATKLKEQQRLEEKAKAKEADERKKRNAEKAQARAELRAQKEAELKEKAREKRARKKEKKRMVAAEVANGATEGESASGAEINEPEVAHESEVKEKTTTVAKRPQKPSVLVKQTKTRALPPPLRNRGKRRMQPWMWVLLVILAVLVLFLVGNGGYSLKFSTSSFGF